ncbi:MAG TPA: LacI family DNA-binding transcriptional regulator [Capsulimonadaceae bacterium]|jgi:LacI family transcriptional regulator
MKTTSLERPAKKKLESAVSLVDVAARARVSVGTVSHVLNQNERARIAPATQERVRKIALEMGYRPNMFARRLHGKPSNTLGLMVAGLQNPFFVAVAREFERVAVEFGYQVVLDTTISEAWAYRKHATNYAWPVDGVFVFSALEQDLNYFLGAQSARLPIVYLGNQEDKPLDNVIFDFEYGGRIVAEHLLNRGYRKIMCLNSANFNQTGQVDRRVVAFDKTLRQGGVTPEYHMLEPIFSIRDAFNAGLNIGRRPKGDLPEVVFCTGDVSAINVYNAFRSLGLRVPEDISVVGFDGIEEAECMEKRLTTVACPIDTFARAATELLIGRISGDLTGDFKQLVIPTALRIGETTR